MFSALLAPLALPLVLIFVPVQVRADMTKLSNSSYVLTIGLTNGCTSTILIHKFVLVFLSDNSILLKASLFPPFEGTLHSFA